MASFSLTDQQLALINRPIESKIFLEGPAGTGKTTAGVGRLLHLLDSRVRARSILVLVPQRTLAAPYYEALRRPTVRAGGQVTISTVGGLAQQAVDLFWPLIAEEAGFGQPDQPPTFLTLETAQYYMARLVRPLLDQGYFEMVTINRNRLYSQVLDDLNKAAVVGFPHTQIGERLKAAWGGEHSQKRIYDEAQACAVRFRDYCLAHNLLDFSLQVEVFVNHLWNLPLCHDYLLTRYIHLIVDNVEEDTPVAHDLLSEWLPHCQSALLIYDQEAGYRRFLGADPQNAYILKKLCQEEVAFTESTVTSPDLRAFGYQLARSLNRPAETPLSTLPAPP
ncbi:MAG: UvrD-helicase domain-containing protein, partial [Anaerolineae bacterium]